MGSVARAEPSTKVTSLTNWDTSQMCAHTDHDQPLWLLDALGISLWVAESLDLDVLGLLDLSCGAVADENWLSTPFDDDLLYARLVVCLIQSFRAC